MDFSDASDFEAIQIDDQLILTARRHIGEPGDILFFEERQARTEAPEFALLLDRISVAPQAPPSGLYAFKGAVANRPVSHVRVFDKDGPKDILVQQRHGGVAQTGLTFPLPVVDVSLSLNEAVTAMRENNARAIVTRASGNDFRLFTNYDVARAFENESRLEDIRDRGHMVSVWPDAIPPVRTRLFSMVRPLDQHVMAVTSLFETIGNAVAHGVKICRCTSMARNHTVFDQTPSLDGSPCVRPIAGHGTYKCF
jgi:hypothetical protein